MRVRVICKTLHVVALRKWVYSRCPYLKSRKRIFTARIPAVRLSIPLQTIGNKIFRNTWIWASLLATCATVLPCVAHAQTYTVVFKFARYETPRQIIRDSAGNFYGATANGGSYNAGKVFKIDTQFRETVLYNFTNGSDGGDPSDGGLVRDQAGNLYGITIGGGNTACASLYITGCGVVFKIDASGKYSLLHRFAGGPDGSYPAGLSIDSKGNLYGTTIFGGDSCNCGTLFELDPAGKFSQLHLFLGEESSDGEDPQGVMAIDSAGNLFGTTWQGGATCFTCGTVYKVDSAGNETILHPFAGRRDGSQPKGLITNGALLYGTTYSGGSSDTGTVFTVDKSGNESVLYSFTGGADGRAPTPGLARDSAGNVYGTTAIGGDAGYGVVFELDSAGRETVLYSFSGKSDGAYPYALIRAANANLYGLSSNGASQVLLFKITP